MATPPTEVVLYAWAIRPPDAPETTPDHTWVTDYDNRVDSYADIFEVKKAHRHYWYCTGNYEDVFGEPPQFHPVGKGGPAGDGFLGCAPALLERAAMFVAPNHETAAGTIYGYFTDGTCHQIANQVLAATAYGWARTLKFPDPDPNINDPLLQQPPTLLMEPLTVHKAHRYWPSVWGFGVYGLRRVEWLEHLRACLHVNFD